MFLKKLINLRHTLAFRLTLWYAAIFTISSLLAFFFFYILVTSVMKEQTDRELLDQVGKFSTLLAVKGIDAVKSVAVVESRAGGVKKTFFRFLYRDGQVFSSSNMSYWKDIGVSKGAVRQLLKGSSPVFETISITGRKHKVRILYGFVGPGIILQLGQSMEIYGRFIEVFQRIFVLTMSLLIFLAALIGWFMARRALGGVEAVTRTARLISRDDLEKRVPVNPRGDEVDQLATTFNQMLDRIKKLVTGMKEMSDNIAHDLRSPITRIRGIAEITLTTGRSLDEYETMAASIVAECDSLLDMINTMLVISEVEAGVGKLELEEMDSVALVRDACELFQPIAEDKGVAIVCNTPDTRSYRGDIRKIQRMISNLIDNAIKYTPRGGKVTVSIRRDGKTIVLSVADTGLGISPTDIPNIFERFYRCDQSRSQEGIGLGLSLARAIARSHGGDITVSSAPGEGSAFTVNI